MNLRMNTLVYLTMMAAAQTASTEPPAPYLQPVEGTALEIAMVPILAKDGQPQYWISRDEISWDLYDALVYRLDVPKGTSDADGGVTRPTKPYLMADRGWGHAGFPALSVSHRGAEAFCAWLSKKTGRTWRLPTVEEWTSLCHSSGADRDPTAAGWIKDNAEGRTHRIGSRNKDGNGLHDFAGNVAEWCRDGNAWVLMGTCYLDAGETPPCGARREPVPEWNDTDPQIPKSIWWLSDAPFAGFRVICEGRPTDGDEQIQEGDTHEQSPAT